MEYYELVSKYDAPTFFENVENWCLNSKYHSEMFRNRNSYEWRISKSEKSFMHNLSAFFKLFSLLKLTVLKRNPPGYIIYEDLTRCIFLYVKFRKKKSSNAFETRKSKFLFFVEIKTCYKKTHPLPSTGFTNIKFDVQKDLLL